jgi:hypothetical protein
MNVHVFKTDIDSDSLIESVKPILNSNQYISDWSIDIEDIDNVLRIVSAELLENEIIKIIKSKGFSCEALPDYSNKYNTLMTNYK